MPYGAAKFSRNLHGDNGGNQAQPLLISNRGRYVWSGQPFAYTFDNGTLTVTSSDGPVESGRQGSTLKEAFLFASRKYFPPDGKLPDPLMFTHPQYNTWIELIYDQNEAAHPEVRAGPLVDQGFPPGVLMIDDNWQEDYGVWEFDRAPLHRPQGHDGRVCTSWASR